MAHRFVSDVLLNMLIPRHFAFELIAIIALYSCPRQESTRLYCQTCLMSPSDMQLRVLLGMAMVVAAHPTCQPTCFDR